ncbi:MAG: hypothetical protein ACREQ5_13085 [Candidatus Dormibacteria bacterium]
MAKPLTVAKTTRDADYYKRLGALGGKQTSARHGAAHYRTIGKIGGANNAAQHDSAHFRELGRQGGMRLAELVRLAKTLEPENDETDE